MPNLVIRANSAAGIFADTQSGGTPALAWNALSITEGATITFTTDGTNNFGGQGPTVKLYMDGRGKTPLVATATSDPEIGDWFSVATGANWLDAGHPNSSASITVIENASARQHVFAVAGSGYHGTEEFQEVFVAWSVKDVSGSDASGNRFPSEDRGEGLTHNVKEAWMMLGNRGDNTIAGGTNHGHDVYIPGISGTALTGGIKGNETTANWSLNLATAWDYNGWNRQHFLVKLNSSSPYGSVIAAFFQACSSEGFFNTTWSGSLMDNQTSEGVSIAAWDRIKMGGFYYSHTGDVRVMDDVYIATGPGAVARIMLANSGVRASITRSGFALPSAWSSSSATATIKLGTIDPSVDEVWAYLYDSSNNEIGPVQLA